MWDEVRQMPPAQRDAFLLREIRGLSYQQLAEELSLSPPSVRSLLLRARTRLRHRLGDVAAAIGGMPWVQTLLRVVLGGDGASPLPAVTKAAAVGLGALALTTGGDLPRATHRPSTTSPRSATTHRAMAQRPRFPESPATRAVVEGESRSGIDNSLDGSSGRDGRHSGPNMTGSVAQLTASSDGHDGGSGSSSGPGPGTLTTTTSSGSGSSGSDSSNSGSGTSGSSGSDGSGISGGSGSDGGGLDG